MLMQWSINSYNSIDGYLWRVILVQPGIEDHRAPNEMGWDEEIVPSHSIRSPIRNPNNTTGFDAESFVLQDD